MKPPSVLVVDDDALFCRSVVDYFDTLGIGASFVTTHREAMACHFDRFSVIVVDKHLPDGEGLSLIQAAEASGAKPSFVVVTGDPSVEHTVKAMRRQAVDYLSKPIDLGALRDAVRRALDRDTQPDVSEPRDQLEEILPGACEEARRYAKSDVSLVITGETGTGKTRLARAIHRASRRAQSPLVCLNCAALAESVIEGELFGSIRGAFTGATDRPGLIELADGGTLFLDEIGEFPLSAQAKLLSVLEDGRVRRVGGARWRSVDIRVIVATHTNLVTAVENGEFREDLLYRLDVGSLCLAPLRDRSDEIPRAVRRLLHELNAPQARMADGEMERLCEYHWPGNFRELRNVLARSLVLHDNEAIRPSQCLRSAMQPTSGPPEVNHAMDITTTLDELARAHTQTVLNHVKGNRAQAARMLGVSVATLRRKLKSWSV